MATDHGYENTLRAVDDSLQKFGYGEEHPDGPRRSFG